MFTKMSDITRILIVLVSTTLSSATREGSFDLNFPSGSSSPLSSYAMTKCLPDFVSFTLCFWLRAQSSNLTTVPISYSNSVHTKALAVDVSSYGASLYLFGRPESILTSKVNYGDGKWHHVCFTWNSLPTTVVAYGDGAETFRFGFFGWNAGTVTKGGGCLVFGQKQTLLCAGFADSFAGSISQVNLWDYPLSPSAVAQVYRGCWTYSGNIFNWCQSGLEQNINGVVDVTTSSLSCDSSAAAGTFSAQENAALVGHVISTNNAPHVFHCASLCLRHCKCSSFNLKRLSPTLYKCEISSASKDTFPAQLQHRESWTYHHRIYT